MSTKNQTITIEDVRKIAKLTKLEVTKDEARLAKMFSETLDYINSLKELDTSKVMETYQVTGLTNVYQKGLENHQTLSKKETLKNAKKVVKDLFATDAVFNR